MSESQPRAEMVQQPPAGLPEHRLNPAWALLPVLSVGLLSWGPFLYVAIRTHARRYQIATAFYLALAIVAGVLAGLGHSHGATNEIAGLIAILLAGAGCVHTLSIRSDYARELALADDPRLLAAEQRAELRRRALEMVRHEPQRALALGIGRPDVEGSFDAGLIDVNHAGAEALASLPGIDAGKAQKIVELRSAGKGFESVADLDLVLDLDEATLSELRQRAIFLPRS